MEIEIYKLIIGVVEDAVKILGPAIITAIVGYKAGKNQLMIKIEEIRSENQFRAREKIFEFRKEKLAKADQSIVTLNESLMQFVGLSLSDTEDASVFGGFINKHLSSHIEFLPFQLNHINDELMRYHDTYKRERDKMQGHIRKAKSIERPKNREEIISTIYELMEIYGFASHCLRILVEKEALHIFEPYTESA